MRALTHDGGMYFLVRADRRTFVEEGNRKILRSYESRCRQTHLNRKMDLGEWQTKVKRRLYAHCDKLRDNDEGMRRRTIAII